MNHIAPHAVMKCLFAFQFYPAGDDTALPLNMQAARIRDNRKIRVIAAFAAFQRPRLTDFFSDYRLYNEVARKLNAGIMDQLQREKNTRQSPFISAAPFRSACRLYERLKRVRVPVFAPASATSMCPFKIRL